VNGWFDRHFGAYRRNQSAVGSVYPNVSAENFNIMPRELAFSLTSDWDKYISRPDTSRGSDYGPRVFTSANGFPTDVHQKLRSARKAQKEEALLRVLRDQVAFVGVPLVAIDAANPNQKDGVAICVAGATSITNTGTKRIATGDLVMWDFPALKSGYTLVSGQPRDKALFVTVPADAALSVREVIDDAADSIDFSGSNKRKRDTGDPDLDLLAESVQKLLEANSASKEKLINAVSMVMKHVQKNHRRVIGIALSSAQPGEQMDILIRAGGAF
jgi:hypothetical protein